MASFTDSMISSASLLFIPAASAGLERQLEWREGDTLLESCGVVLEVDPVAIFGQHTNG
jgi:hypothetical protein